MAGEYIPPPNSCNHMITRRIGAEEFKGIVGRKGVGELCGAFRFQFGTNTLYCQYKAIVLVVQSTCTKSTSLLY